MYGYFGRSLDLIHNFIIPSHSLTTYFNTYKNSIVREIEVTNDLTCLCIEENDINSHLFKSKFNRKVLATTAVGNGCKCCN